MDEIVRNVYGMGPDYKLKWLGPVNSGEFSLGKQKAFDAGFKYAITEFGKIRRNGTWRNPIDFKFEIFEKGYPGHNTNIRIGNWSGYVKSVTWNSSFVTFSISDPNRNWKDFDTGYGINGVTEGIQMLKELAALQDWEHRQLFLDAQEQKKIIINHERTIKKLQLEVDNLKEEINDLITFKDAIIKSQSSIRRLYKLVSCENGKTSKN